MRMVCIRSMRTTRVYPLGGVKKSPDVPLKERAPNFLRIMES